MRAASFIAVVFLLVGCVPYHLHDAAPVAGRVVSRVTGKPIAAASVSLTATSSEAAGRTVQTVTDPHGYFSLPPIEHWIVAPLSDGYADGAGTLRVEAPGYRLYLEKRKAIKETLVIPLTPKT
jgi:hypothetical protein